MHSETVKPTICINNGLNMPKGVTVTKYMHGPAAQVSHFFNANNVTLKKKNMAACPAVTTICSIGEGDIMFNTVR